MHLANIPLTDAVITEGRYAREKSRGCDDLFERASTIIRDGSKFDYGYVPKALVHREEQMSRMELLFRPLADQHRSCTAFLTGGVGTGKTVTANRFCEDLRAYLFKNGRRMDTVYINCRNSSEAGAMITILRHFDPGFPLRGFSVEDMSRSLAIHLSSNQTALTVILDEVDVLLKKGPCNLVYQLTRSSGTAPVSLIMISQFPLDNLLDEASMSTFKRSNTVRFNSYSRDELREIVAARAEEALLPGKITEEALDLIAEQSAEYGDARMAIELLERASAIAEEDTLGEVTVEHARSAKAMTYSSVSEAKLRTLDINRMAVLLAVARAMKQNLSIQTSAAEKTYAVVCEEYNLKARKHTQYWNYLQDLDRAGVVKIEIVDDSTGRNSIVKLTDIPSKVLAEKMESLIEEKLTEDDEDALRPLRTRCRHIPEVQRDPSVRRALHEVRGPQGQEGDPQADTCLRRGQDSRCCLRRQGQHGGPEDGVVRVRSQERRGGPCDNHR